MTAEWTGIFGETHLRITARQDGVVRVTRDLDGNFRESPVHAACPSPAGQWDHTRDNRSEIFMLPGMEIRVDRETGAVSFRAEKPLLREQAPRLEKAEIWLNEFRSGGNVQETRGVDGARASAVPLRSRMDRAGVRGSLRFQLREGEAIYGLGSHEEGYGNLRGHERLLYQHNLKAVVPVLVSTEGWGILFDMGCAMIFRDSADGMELSFECADTADWYFLHGDYRSMMKQMRSLTGPAPMLPRYALGFIQSKERYVTAEELTAVAYEYRRRKIPLDMVVQDWQTWPEGQWGLKRLDRDRFPEGFVKPLHDMHVRVMLSVWPNLQGEKNSDREELLAEGCMLGNQSTYNAFLPKAREIYWNQIRRELLGEGIDAWWCDCTEPFECDWNGKERPSDRRRMELNTGEARKYMDPTLVSLYSLCHSRGIYEGTRRDCGGRRVLNVTRSSWAGQHRYGAVTWSGDVCATWETLRRHIPEGMNFTVTGEPWWNCDIGGFFTDRKDPWFWRGDFPDGVRDPGYRELFVRWMQYACFLTLMRAHGTDTPREIWQFGEKGEPFYDAIALCIRMRYRLLAYQYSLMAETCADGIPMLRIPALVFPEDRHLREVDWEMMLGDSLLVCPVTRPMYCMPGGEKICRPDENVQVYLPAGYRWYAVDGGPAWDGGQTVTVQAPLNRIPVFARAGAILPVSGPRQYTEENPNAAVELRVFPGADGSFTFYDDDGETYDYENGAYQRIRITWEDRTGILTLAPQEGGMRRERRFRVKDREILYTGVALSLRL